MSTTQPASFLDEGFGHFFGCGSPTCDGSCYDDYCNLVAARRSVHNFQHTHKETLGGGDIPLDLPYWRLVYDHLCERLHRPPTFEAFLEDCRSEWNAETQPQRRAVDLGRRQ